MTGSLFDSLRRPDLDPALPAIEAADGRRLSRQDLFDIAARLAAGLAAQGVGPESRVLVQAEKSIEHLALFLAVQQRGAVFIPLNTAYTPAEIDYFVRDAEPALLVCDPQRQAGFAASAGAVGAAVATLDAAGATPLLAPAESSLAAAEPRRAGDLAAILYTSGTTGRSKGAMLSNANLASNIETLVEAWRFSPADRLIHALPIFHTHGLFVAAGVALAAGAPMLWFDRFDAEAVLSALPRATCLMGVPTFYTRLLQLPGLDRAATAGMRLFASGSAPLLAETHREWEARTGHSILERYGMTETVMLTSNPYAGARRPGTVGPPLPGVALRITDPRSGDALAPSAVGMIEVKGPNVFSGYWRMPEKTAAEFRQDGFFITGDLGCIEPDGYVRIVGRGKDLVISGGLNVYPKEVESEIDAIPGVLESAVIGVPHADLGEGVVAVVVLRAGRTPTEADILAALAPRLARFKQPKRIVFLPDLPRNTMGKVQKAALRERFAGLFSAGAPPA